MVEENSNNLQKEYEIVSKKEWLKRMDDLLEKQEYIINYHIEILNCIYAKDLEKLKDILGSGFKLPVYVIPHIENIMFERLVHEIWAYIENKMMRNIADKCDGDFVYGIRYGLPVLLDKEFYKFSKKHVDVEVGYTVKPYY